MSYILASQICVSIFLVCTLCTNDETLKNISLEFYALDEKTIQLNLNTSYKRQLPVGVIYQISTICNGFNKDIFLRYGGILRNNESIIPKGPPKL